MFFFFCPQTPNLLNSIIKAQKIKKNIGIIISRNQVDIKKGYLNNFDTKKFINYVKNKNKNILICRDHGGIFKRDDEKKIKYKTAYQLAKKSFLNDARLDFDKLHLDSEFFKNRYQESKDFLDSVLKINKNMNFEFGEEKKNKKLNIKKLTNDINFCLQYKNIKELVTYTGSHLYGLKNIGKLNIKNLKIINKLLLNKKITIKDHNCDYLSKNEFKQRKKYKIKSFNIGPELTHIENKLLSHYGNKYAQYEYKKFKKFVVNEKKWKKWTKNKATINEKFLVSAHYYYNNDKYKKLINKIKKRVDFNSNIQEILTKKIIKIVK